MTIYKKLYASLIESIDAIDNGIERFESTQPPRYALNSDLKSRVQRLAPSWTEADSDSLLMAQFEKAVALTCTEFDEQLDNIVRDWLPAREIVAAAFASRFDVHASGTIIVLPRYCPYSDHLAGVRLNVFVCIRACLVRLKIFPWQ